MDIKQAFMDNMPSALFYLFSCVLGTTYIYGFYALPRLKKLREKAGLARPSMERRCYKRDFIKPQIHLFVLSFACNIGCIIIYSYSVNVTNADGFRVGLVTIMYILMLVPALTGNYKKSNENEEDVPGDKFKEWLKIIGKLHNMYINMSIDKTKQSIIDRDKKLIHSWCKSYIKYRNEKDKKKQEKLKIKSKYLKALMITLTEESFYKELRAKISSESVAEIQGMINDLVLMYPDGVDTIYSQIEKILYEDLIKNEVPISLIHKRVINCETLFDGQSVDKRFKELQAKLKRVKRKEMRNNVSNTMGEVPVDKIVENISADMLFGGLSVNVEGQEDVG